MHKQTNQDIKSSLSQPQTPGKDKGKHSTKDLGKKNQQQKAQRTWVSKIVGNIPTRRERTLRRRR